MSGARGIADRPDLDQARALLPLYVDGVLPSAVPSAAYEGRLQIHNGVGMCMAELVSGNAPPGTVVSVDQATQQVVITWPAYTQQAAPIQNPGFEDGAVGWDFGTGWSVTTDNPIAGARAGAYSDNHGESLLVSRSWLPTNPGDVVNATCQVRQGASSKGNAGAAVLLQYRNAAGTVVHSRGGNAVMSASNNAVFPSNVQETTPAGLGITTINMAILGIRNRQNLRVWVDSCVWDHKIPAVGINIETTVCLTVRVRDSAGRSALHSQCLAVAPPVFVQTLLSAVNKTGDVILSNGDTQAESNSTTGGGVVLSVSGKASGKFYFEVGVTQFYTVNNSMGVGLHRGIAGLATYLGGDVDGWGLWDRGTTAGSETYTNNVASNSSLSGDFDLGVRIRVAVDLSAGRIWFGQSNRSSGAWFNGGDPATGTNPTYTFTPGGDTFYLSLCPRRGDTSVATNRNRLQLILPVNWSFAAPTGFGVWT